MTISNEFELDGMDVGSVTGANEGGDDAEAPPHDEEVRVEEVQDDETPQEVLTPERAKRVQDRQDRLVAQYMAEGVERETAQRLVALALTTGSRQRHLPGYVTATSLEARAFFASRSVEDIEGDCIKGIRQDGGPQGSQKAYADKLLRAGVDSSVVDAAAEAVSLVMDERLSSIRRSMVQTFNELRVRRAEAEGVDPKTVRYLKASTTSVKKPNAGKVSS